MSNFRFIFITLIMILLSNGCSNLEKRLAPKMRYSLTNEDVFPGEVVQFTAQLPKGVKKGKVKFLNRTFEMYPRLDLEAGTYTAYLPIPGKLKPGQYKLKAKFPVIKASSAIYANFSIRLLPNEIVFNEHQVKLKRFNRQQYEQDLQTIRKLLTTSTYRPDKLRDFVLPLSGRIVGTYGTTRIYNRHHRIALKGLEIEPLTSGTMEVQAAAEGKVVFAEQLPMLGNCVLIDHGRSFMTLCCHLKSIIVVPNQLVRRGETIGLVGRSGGAAINQRLYYQLFVAGVAISIERYVGLNVFE